MLKNKVKKTITILLALVLTLAVLAGCDNNANDNTVVNIDPLNPTASINPSAGNGTADPTDFGPTPTPGAGEPISNNINPDNTLDPDALDGTEDEAATPEPKRTYAEYREINSDVIGWIKIKDTNVDYPVVHSHDNKDYLIQSATKTNSKSGAIFLDYRAKTNGKHLILFGHNMSKSKTMFAQVTSYGQRAFYDNHRTFELTLGDTTYTYKVFSVYSVDMNDAQYMAVDFENDDQFLNYMNNTLAGLSMFPVDTQVGAGDQVLTLSTCSHTDYANGRFVVHAVRVG